MVPSSLLVTRATLGEGPLAQRVGEIGSISVALGQEEEWPWRVEGGPRSRAALLKVPGLCTHKRFFLGLSIFANLAIETNAGSTSFIKKLMAC